ncbi:hypothetical protein [Thalassospira xiamenensis]|uniref:hypothetical protein n=1 Tax=Thalassospira xiamenensis TaxID=220697 RepID=UPI003AA8675F
MARLLEARGESGLNGHGIAESGRSGQRDHEPSVGEAGGGPRYVRASVVMALPKGAGAGSGDVGGQWPVDGGTGECGEPEGRLLARMADARSLSGGHGGAEVPPWPEVIGSTVRS